MPRFVILSHDWPLPHLDLLLESGGVLRAWRLPSGFDTHQPALAEANADHRMHYLDYEGPVSGNRGTVTRWDTGELSWELVESERIVIRLSGTRLDGRFELIHQTETLWQFRRLEISAGP